MLEIVLYNLIFWTVWIFLSTLPARIMQFLIDNHDIEILPDDGNLFKRF